MVLLFTSLYSIAQSETLSSGAFIINMGATPYTIANGIKPYGLIYDLIRNYNVPVKWVINPNKVKDGVDFNYNGINFSGGTFIIPVEYRSTNVNNRINYWLSQGVIGVNTISPLNINVTYTIKSFPKWTLDAKNGAIAELFIKNAGINNTAFPGAYNWKDPQTLDCCDDFFVMPHADPKWSTHGKLWSWNKDCLGSIWAGCHAVSVLENMKNPLNVAQQTNFLTTTGLLLYSAHTKGSVPYLHQFVTDPVAQYLGSTDLAQLNGSEQIYMPLVGGAWRPTSKIITVDPTQENVPVNSPGPAAVNVYGRGMGSNDRGYVMYEGGHNINKGTINDVAAQRAFWNFSFFQLIIKSPQITVSGITSDLIINAGSTITGLNATATSPVNGVTYSYQWSSTCGGTFSNPTASNTNYSAPAGSTTSCIITCKVKDNCGRSSFQSFTVKILGATPPALVNDALTIDPGCANPTFSINVLTNDSDPDGQNITLTNVTGALNGTIDFTPDGKVNYTPNKGFVGQEIITYTACDNTSPSPLCSNGTYTITVGNPSNVPNVVNDNYTIAEDAIGTFNVLANDNPIIAGPLTVSGIASGPVNGKVSINTDNTITYVPNTDFAGTDQFTYYVVNALGYLSSAIVNVTIINDDCNAGTWQSSSPTYDVKSYTASADAEIDSIIALKNTGTSTTLNIDASSGNQQSRSLLKFDLTSLPVGCTITSSKLRLVRNGGTTAAQNIGAYSLTNDWNEGTLNDQNNTSSSDGVTWYTTSFSNQWLVPGGDFSTTNGSVTNVSSATGGVSGTSTYEWNITAITQSWFNNSQTNKGIILKDVSETSADNKTFASSENLTLANRPVLRVTYTPLGGGSDVTVDVQPTKDAYIYESTTSKVFGNGGSYNVLVSQSAPQRILVKFPISNSDIPMGSIVDSAKLVMTRTAGTGVIDVAAYQVTNSWNEAAGNNKSNSTTLNGATWNQRNYTNNWTKIGGDYTATYGSQITVDNTGSTYNWNVKNIVQNWIKNSPEPNNGFLLKAVNENSNTTLTFAARENSTTSLIPKLDIYYKSTGTCSTIPVRAPMAMPDTASVVYGLAINIDLSSNDYYPVNSSLTYSIITAPINGTATINGAGIINYSPSGNFNGITKLIYRVTDNSSGLYDDANVFIIVKNAPLSAYPDIPTGYNSGITQTINVKGNDSDPEGNLGSATITLLDLPKSGTASVNGSGNIVYIPVGGFTGKDTLSYIICEPSTTCTSGYCDTANVILTVQNQPPVPKNDTATILPCLSATINLMANDNDPEGHTLTISSLSALSVPAAGTLINNNDGTVTFNPATGFSGIVNFTYSVTDNGTPALTSVSPVNVTIVVNNPANTAPVANDDYENTMVDESLFANVRDNDYDPENQDLTLPVITLAPLHGTVTVNQANGLIEYTPAQGYTGLDELTYQVCDKIIDQNVCSATPTLCTTAKLNITVLAVPPPFVEPITGFNAVVAGSILYLENITPGGIWSSSNPNIATVDSNGTVTALVYGTVDILYTVTNAYGSTTVSISINVTNSSSNSGFAGGLESKSLGEGFATRVYNNVRQSNPALVDYRKTPKFSLDNSTAQRQLSRTTQLQLGQFFPEASLLGNNIIAYVTTPVDILSFTNATDVFAVDYTSNGTNRAVAFATKTYNQVYTHTKPVCDRLKGAVLINVDSLVINQFHFLRYYLMQPNGVKEYAVSFSIGESAGNNKYALQSEWMTDTYQQADTLFNFQIWSPESRIVNLMVEDIINKFSQVKPIDESGNIRLPKAYFTYLNRVDSNQLQLVLEIKNNTAATQGIIQISGKQNEQTSFTNINDIPVTLTPFGNVNKIIMLKDIAEAEIKLIINGTKEDFVYTNDGTWNVYSTPASNVTTFQISNDTIQPKKSEKRLFRNIKLVAKTSDYVSVYRVLKGGAEVDNLTPYKFLKFTATGQGKVRIRIIKKSIVKYNEQYEYMLDLSGVDKEYVIATSNFKSSLLANTIQLNDVAIVSFTFEADKPNTTISASLQNVRFDKYNTEALDARKLVISPNPVKEMLHCIFDAEIKGTYTLKCIELGSGKFVFSRNISANTGLNDVTIPIPFGISQGMYVIKLIANETEYKSKVIFIKPQ